MRRTINRLSENKFVLTGKGRPLNDMAALLKIEKEFNIKLDECVYNKNDKSYSVLISGNQTPDKLNTNLDTSIETDADSEELDYTKFEPKFDGRSDVKIMVTEFGLMFTDQKSNNPHYPLYILKKLKTDELLKQRIFIKISRKDTNLNDLASSIYYQFGIKCLFSFGKEDYDTLDFLSLKDAVNFMNKLTHKKLISTNENIFFSDRNYKVVVGEELLDV